MKSGFVAVLGRANVGKSSLINKLVGEKVAIVSPKPQTTRNRILGVLTGEGYQIVFADTPGVHRGDSKLSEYMMKSVDAAAQDTDVVLVVIDGERGLLPADIALIDKYKGAYPLIVVYNKIDTIPYERAYPELERLAAIEGVTAIVPVSARTGKNTQHLLAEILKNIPEGGQKYFPDDEYTDKNIRFIVAEIIREKALLCLNDEIPHGIGVVITAFNQSADRCEISADILCDKPNHKPIIIGASGSMIKKIGQWSRQDAEKLLSTKVRLELFVRVERDWRNRFATLSETGYR